MKTTTYTRLFNYMWRSRHICYLKVPVLVLVLLLTIQSCEKGEFGEPGLAFVAFTWVDSEPDYIEIANDFIPAVFYWDWYYRVDPGVYSIYYEGTRRVSGGLQAYAWELEYEVWENPAKQARYRWDEAPNAPDAYFTIELSPSGPKVYHEDIYPDKSSPDTGLNLTIPEVGTSIIVEKANHNYNLRLTYKRVMPN